MAFASQEFMERRAVLLTCGTARITTIQMLVRFSKPLLILILMMAPPFIAVTEAIDIRSSTALNLSPSPFRIKSGVSVILTATLTSNDQPLPNKRIKFIATPGNVSPNNGTTDLEGKVAVTYIAPAVGVRTPVEIVASFLGDLKYEGSYAALSGTIEAEQLPTTRTQGAAFSIPPSIRDVISQYIAMIPEEVQKTLLPIPSTGFFLATKENLSLVLADQSDKGIATVEGRMLPQDIVLNDVSLNVIFAEKVSFNKEGKPATVGEILSNPKDYELELVKLLAFRKQASILYDPDDGSEIEVPVTIGYLTEECLNVTELTLHPVMRDAIRNGRDFIEDPSITLVKDLLRIERSRLAVFNFEHDYWMDCQAETNGIIVAPATKILDLLRRIVPIISELIVAGEDPVLYDVNTTLKYKEVSSIEEINQETEDYIGNVIGLSAYGFGGAISVQESIEDATGETIPVDILLEGLEAWNELSTPPEKEELLVVVGASNVHQDEVFRMIDGEFKYIGRVISAKEIDETFPSGILAFVVYHSQKIGKIEGLAESVKEEIEGKVQEIDFILTNFMEEQPPSIIPIRFPLRVVNPIRPIVVDTLEELPEIIVITTRVEFRIGNASSEIPVTLKLENSSISRIEIQLADIREHVNMTIEKLHGKPSDLPEPEGIVWAYHEISVSVPDEAIKTGRISFSVLKEWLETNGVSAENITLCRYHAGRWEKLLTEIVGEDLTHINYSTETRGFSTFAIVGEAPAERITVTETVTETVTQTMIKTVVETMTEIITETEVKTITMTAPAQTVRETTTEIEAVTETTTSTVSVLTMDVTSVAGAGIVALIVGVIVGWLVGKK